MELPPGDVRLQRSSGLRSKAQRSLHLTRSGHGQLPLSASSLTDNIRLWGMVGGDLTTMRGITSFAASLLLLSAVIAQAQPAAKMPRLCFLTFDLESAQSPAKPYA